MKQNTLHTYQVNSEKSDSYELRDFWSTIKHYKKSILFIIFFCLVASILYALFSRPIYRATATLQIERESNQIVDISLLNPGDIRDTKDFYETQFELIKSHQLAKRTIQQLGLTEQLSKPSWMSRLFNATSSNNPLTAEKRFLELVTIEPIKNSKLVAIHVDSSDAETSAKIANAIVSNFQSIQQEQRQSDAEAAKSMLSNSIQAAKIKLEEANQSLSQYVRDNEIIQDENDELRNDSEEISRLTREINQINFARKQNRQQKMHLSKDDFLKHSYSGGLSTSFQKALSAYRQAEQNYESNKTRRNKTRRNQALTKLKKMRAFEIKELEALTAQQLQTENALKEQLAQLKAEAILRQSIKGQYLTLQREVETNQALYQSLIQRLKEINVAGLIGNNTIIPVDQAQADDQKFKPKLKTLALFGLLLGSLLGLGLAFIREFFDDSINNIDKIEAQTGLSVIGFIPKASKQLKLSLAEVVIQSPRSPIAESIRSARTAIHIAEQANHHKITFITSAAPDEGKTTLSMNLGYAFACANKNVLLIEGDLRKPTIAHKMQLDSKSGLVDVFNEKIKIESAFQDSKHQNMKVMVAGTAINEPVELLSSPSFQELLQRASKYFDHIIIDGPPTLGLADAQILASLSDSVLFVAQAEKTSMKKINNALKRLQATQKSISLILNQVEQNGRIDYEDNYYQY